MNKSQKETMWAAIIGAWLVVGAAGACGPGSVAVPVIDRPTAEPLTSMTVGTFESTTQR